MANFDATDVRRAEQLLAVLKRARYDIQGEEALALSQVIQWAVTLPGRIRAAVPEPAEPTPGRPGRRAKS